MSSMLPVLPEGWLDSWDNPRFFGQPFGMDFLDYDFLPPTFYRGYPLRPRIQRSIGASGQSVVKDASDKFQVMLNVSQFKPDEVNVKTVDNYVVIHGKHEEKSDEHGFIAREFTRRYLLPEGTEPATVTSSMSQNGVLIIEAPKKFVEPPPSNERVIPITMEKRSLGQK